MWWMLEDPSAVPERLDQAWAALRARAGENAEAFEEIADDTLNVDDHLAGCARTFDRWQEDPAEFKYDYYNESPVSSLLIAEGWRLTHPDATLPAFPDGATPVDGGWQIDQPTAWFGDVRVPGSLELRAPLVVLGSLTVDGLLDDGDVDYSHLAVGGDVRARALVSGAFHLVSGSLTADVIRCFNNDGSLMVAGDIVADLLDPENHYLVQGGELRVRVDIEEIEDVESVALWLPAGYTTLGDRGPIDMDRIVEEAAAGRSPVLPQARPVEYPAALVAAVAAPAGVTELNLSGEPLDALPEDMNRLTELTHLDLSNTSLLGLDRLAGLDALRSLSIRSTPVTSLVPLEGLRGLEHLDITGCRLMEDWGNLSRLPKLTTFIANDISNVPWDVEKSMRKKLGAGFVENS